MPSEMAEQAGVGEKKKGKRLWWIKLPKDFFTSNNVIKKMRKLPGGDTYVVITLKLLLLALDNEFRIYYEGVEDTFAKDIALTLDESAEAVDVTLRMLIAQGWIVEESSDVLMAPKSLEMAGSESESAKRVRDYRERIKNENPNLLPLHCNQNVTLEKKREEKRRKENREMQERKDLPTLCPDAFLGGKPKVSPSFDEVRQFAENSRFYALSPDDFYSAFSSQDWTVDGQEITDWISLYVSLEGMYRRNGEGGEG